MVRDILEERTASIPHTYDSVHSSHFILVFKYAFSAKRPSTISNSVFQIILSTIVILMMCVIASGTTNGEYSDLPYRLIDISQKYIPNVMCWDVLWYIC